MRDPEVYISEEAAKSYNMILVTKNIFRIPSMNKQFVCRSRMGKTIFDWDSPHDSTNRLLHEAFSAGITHIFHRITVSPVIDPVTFVTRHHTMFKGLRILVPLENEETVDVLDRLSD